MIRGLPPTALLRTPRDEHGAEPWTVTDELLAQAVEEVSLMVAQRQRAEPREIARPPHIRRRQQGDAYKRGLATLAATSRTVIRAS